MDFRYFLEYLPTINSISVFVESIQKNDAFNSIRIFMIDSNMIKLTLNNDKQLYIPLPIDIDLENKVLETCYKVQSNNLIIKLPIQSSISSINRSINLMSINSNSNKWNYQYLASKLKFFKLNCINCDALILNSSNVSKISEMPSEIWSELMDFWHCHKPHDHQHHHQDEGSNFNDRFKLTPLKDEILIGNYYFAFNGPDNTILENILLKDSISCSNCFKEIGELDQTNKGLIKIFKWNLKLITGQLDKLSKEIPDQSSKEKRMVEIYNPSYYIYNTIIDNINSNATRIIHFTNNEKTINLLIWVFNTNITYSINSIKNFKKNSMKIYYTTNLKNIEIERKDRGELETITIQDIVLVETIKELDELNKNLPTSLKQFGKNWNLGFLNID